MSSTEAGGSERLYAAVRAQAKGSTFCASAGVFKPMMISEAALTGKQAINPEPSAV
jgi:hypothetical protein